MAGYRVQINATAAQSPVGKTKRRNRVAERLRAAADHERFKRSARDEHDQQQSRTSRSLLHFSKSVGDYGPTVRGREAAEDARAATPIKCR